MWGLICVVVTGILAERAAGKFLHRVVSLLKTLFTGFLGVLVAEEYFKNYVNIWTAPVGRSELSVS